MSRYLTMLDDVEITRAEDVDKHGDHDQSEHGNWARGVLASAEITTDGKTITEIINRVKDEGGLTINMVDGSEPQTGYTFARGAKYGSVVDAQAFYKDEDVLAAYYIKHKADLTGGKYHLGLWHNDVDGQVYLDVSENIQDKERAIAQGRKNDQISIWDVVNKKEIPTGGSGAVKEVTSSGDSRFVKDDRRGDSGLRQRSLGEVAKREPRYKVIYFDYGLKPVLKHPAGGDHDQADHGSWATGRSKEDVERISQMKDKGPTLKRLDEALDSATGEIDRDKAKMMIDNDSYLNEEVEDRITNLINTIEEQDGEPMSEEDKLANYGDYRNQVIEEYIDQEPDFLENFSQENDYGSLQDPQVMQELKDSMQEVYGVELTSEFRDGERQGESVTLRSEVSEVFVQGNDIQVNSVIVDEQGNTVSTEDIVRVFSKDEENGTWSVEHKFLKIDKEFRGLGFGGKFLQQSEDFYVGKGLTHITLNAGLEDGARHWANSGFDWNRDELPSIIENIGTYFEEQQFIIDTNGTGLMPVSQKIFAAQIEEGRGILSRMKDSNGNPRDMKEDNFPTPREFASLGAGKTLMREDGKSTWAGKELFSGKYIPYIKVLTAEGQNLLSGPVDMDGDGLVYDGTPREKPVSSVGNK